VDIAGAMMFVLTLVAEVIVGLYVLIYAMHAMLTVVQETAAGNDEIAWPSEGFIDWLFGSLHLVVLVLVLLAPAGILMRALQPTLFPDDAVLRFLVLAVPGLWLLFPVALLSSLSTEHRWMLLRPDVMWRMLRAAPATLAVYVAGAVLAAGAGALWYAALAPGGRSILMPVAAAASAAAFLIYARLLGRLAWVMGQVPTGKRKRGAAAKKEKPKKTAAAAHDPWAAPDEPPESEKEPEAPKTPTKVAPDGEAYESYGLGDEPVKPPTYAETAPKKKKRERAAVPKRLPPAKAVTWPMVRGVYAFPFRGDNAKAWMWLALGALAWGAGAVVLIGLLPRVTGG
jgi:hypothetical protein